MGFWIGHFFIAQKYQKLAIYAILAILAPSKKEKIHSHKSVCHLYVP